jgi:hypothetical protein
VCDQGKTLGERPGGREKNEGNRGRVGETRQRPPLVKVKKVEPAFAPVLHPVLRGAQQGTSIPLELPGMGERKWIACVTVGVFEFQGSLRSMDRLICLTA